MSGKVHIRFWGRLSDQFGREQTRPLSEGETVNALTHSLGQVLLDPSIRIFLNGTHITENANLSAGDKLEFLPPVGGG